MFQGTGSLVRCCFWENRKLLFGKTESWRRECKKFSFFAHKNIFNKPQIFRKLTSLLCKAKLIFIPTFHQSTPLLHHAKSWFCSNFSTQPTLISPFRRNNITCVQFPFKTATCGVKPALQLQFFTKPNSASYQKFPFRTGSKHGRACLRHWQTFANFFNTLNVSSFTWNSTARVLNRSPGVQRAAALGVFLVTFCTPQKVTEKTSLPLLFEKRKVCIIIP